MRLINIISSRLQLLQKALKIFLRRHKAHDLSTSPSALCDRSSSMFLEQAGETWVRNSHLPLGYRVIFVTSPIFHLPSVIPVISYLSITHLPGRQAKMVSLLPSPTWEIVQIYSKWIPMYHLRTASSIFELSASERSFILVREHPCWTPLKTDSGLDSSLTISRGCLWSPYLIGHGSLPLSCQCTWLDMVDWLCQCIWLDMVDWLCQCIWLDMVDWLCQCIWLTLFINMPLLHKDNARCVLLKDFDKRFWCI